MAKRRPRKSAAQRKAEAEALQATIVGKVEQLRSSEQWVRFLEFTSGFHTYSFKNLMLIWSQCPQATRVAGYGQWQRKGRQVRKGERSIKIFGYSQKRITEEDPETGEELVRRIPRFPVLSVFDISQTDLMPGHEDHSTVVRRLTGEDVLGVYDQVAAFLAERGCTVRREPMTSPQNGYTTPAGEVVINDRISGAQAAKTIIHEAAHVVLGHAEDLSEYTAHRGRHETEAESVAYVVAGMLGLDTSDYSIGYVAGWSDGDVEMIHATGERVVAAAQEIAAALLGDAAEDNTTHEADETAEGLVKRAAA